MNAAELTKALGGRWNGQGGKARCPAHDDRTPSLSVSDGIDGRILVHCQAGCGQDAVLDALRARGIWPNGQDAKSSPPWAKPSPNLEKVDRTPNWDFGRSADLQTDQSADMHSSRKLADLPISPTGLPDWRAVLKTEPSEFWDYRTADGALVGWTARVESPEGKKILPVSWVDGAWVCKAFPEPRPLYGLPALAQRPHAPVLLVEGEKTACAAGQLLDDYVAITWPGGTNAVAKVDWSPLTGRDVTLWPDADEPGRKAMAQIGPILLRIGARTVRGVKLPEGLPAGWDLADPIPEGVDVDKLLAEVVDLRAQRAASLPVKSAAVIDATDYPEPKWAIPDMVPDGVCILAGPKSRGKSFISLDFGVAVASGGPALGNIQCEQGSVLYLALEDGERRIKGRTRAILQGRIVPAALEVATEWRTIDDGGLDDIETWIIAHPDARLVVVDVLAKIKGRPDPNRGVYDQDYATIGPFHRLAHKHGVAVLLVHHTNKGSAADPVLRISGTMGLSGAADTTLVLSREARDPHGTLDVRGRDVPEREIALQFDKDTGCVTALGPADDFRRSEERRAIIRALIDGGPMRPAELAKAIGKRDGNVRRRLFDMKKDGDVIALRDGRYQAAE